MSGRVGEAVPLAGRMPAAGGAGSSATESRRGYAAFGKGGIEGGEEGKVTDTPSMALPDGPVKYLSPGEVAVQLGLSVDTIYRLTRSGAMPRIKLTRRVLISAKTLDRWLKGRQRSET